VAIESWIVALIVMTVIGVALWVGSAIRHTDLLNALPEPLRILLDVCGAYAGISALCLYITMWIYWIAVQRSPIGTRIGWLLALILGVHYGVLIYACWIWRTSTRKVGGAQSIPSTPAVG
jgi:hypothetical protein